MSCFLFRRAQESANPKDSTRAASTAQNPMSQAKVAAYPYKSFGQAFSKACRVEGQRPRRSRRSETPQRNLTNKAKQENEKQNEKIKAK